LKLIFIRHGLAEGHFLFNEMDDFDRELTPEGKLNLESSYKQFKKYQKNIDIIFTSPLLRAVESAEILWTAYPEADLELMSDLDILDDPGHLVEYINLLPAHGTYAFVGHNPHLFKVISLLLMQKNELDVVKFKKGGICCLSGGLLKGYKIELILSPKFLLSL